MICWLSFFDWINPFPLSDVGSALRKTVGNPMPETPHGLYQVTLTETASLRFHQREKNSSMFSLYPLVNVYITMENHHAIHG